MHPDTDVTPYDMATLGSRSLYHMGNAVRLAAEDAKAKLAALAKEVGVPEGSNVPVAELFQKKYKMQAGNIIGTGSYIPNYVPPDANGLTPEATPFWMVGGTGAEVEVDTETGHVRVLKLINVADVGRPVNPRIVDTQLSGAATMQFGFTMQEKIEFDGGQITNASFADYKIPSIVDIPPSMQNEAVESEQGTGPFGAKGVGEIRHVRRVAGDRQRDRGRLRGAADDAERVFRALRTMQAGRWRSAHTWEYVVSVRGEGGRKSQRLCILARGRRDDGMSTREHAHDQFHSQRRTSVHAGGRAPDHRRGVARPLRSVRRARELCAGTVRLLYGAGRRHRGVWLPLSRGAWSMERRSPRSKASPRAASSRPSRKPSWKPGRRSADSARPASC